MINQCLHIFVSGLVQGVYFRANSLKKAKTLGVTGWIKNLDDGRVELMVEGEKNFVDQMLKWCKHGPPGAKIDNVSVDYELFQNKFTEFIIKY